VLLGWVRALGFSTSSETSHMQNTRLLSPEVAARRARALRAAADESLMNISLGDPPPGRSWLDRQRARPPADPKPPFSISACRTDATRVTQAFIDRETAIKLQGRSKRRPGASPLRGGGRPKARPSPRPGRRR
jgi:hypothetical protein